MISYVYLLLIFFIILYSYTFIRFTYYEKFIGDMGLEFKKYNQLHTFINDKNNYDFDKDSGVMRGVNDFITFGEIEYKNLKDKIIEKNKQNEENKDTPFEKKKIETKDVNYPIIRKPKIFTSIMIIKCPGISLNISNFYCF